MHHRRLRLCTPTHLRHSTLPLPPFHIHPEIRDALSGNAPIVVLESAVVTHGLPRVPIQLPRELMIDDWDASQPANLALARAMSRAVRSAGATPAMIAVLDGTLTIGLDDEQVIRLARDANAEKASISSMASVMARGGTAGVTVSATLAACALTHTLTLVSGIRAKNQSPRALLGLRFFATGGVGGVHRNWQQVPDISADLSALAHTPVCVVCSGAKSILDLPATLEMLEALGVPVVGYRTNSFPQFQCVGDESLKVSQRIDDESAIAKLCAGHWHALHLKSAIVLANPPPQKWAMNSGELESAIAAAESRAVSHGIAGPARTPFLLDEIARQTQNRSLFANLALLIENAKLAAHSTVAFAKA